MLIFCLKNECQEKNQEEIKSIAHRIAPMFKQIQANEIGQILKKLEKDDLNTLDLDNMFIDLKEKMNVLFDELKQEV